MYIKDNMKIVAVFDADDSKKGTLINHLKVQPMKELSATVQQLDISVGIITVPAREAQNVADQFAAAGIRGILNFAPVVLKTAPGVRIHHADFTAELLSLAYYMEHNKISEDGSEDL